MALLAAFHPLLRLSFGPDVAANEALIRLFKGQRWHMAEVKVLPSLAESAVFLGPSGRLSFLANRVIFHVYRRKGQILAVRYWEVGRSHWRSFSIGNLTLTISVMTGRTFWCCHVPYSSEIIYRFNIYWHIQATHPFWTCAHKDNDHRCLPFVSNLTLSQRESPLDLDTHIFIIYTYGG